MSYIVRFFDKLEDKVRNQLSHWAIIYAFIGGALTVLFWRGVWHSADLIEQFGWAGLWQNILASGQSGHFFSSFILSAPVSTAVSAALLLLTGLFVSVFIGDRILLSGIKHEKKIFEKTEEEVKSEVDLVSHINNKMAFLEKELKSINDIIAKK